MAASNTRDCFRELIGHTITGVLFDEGETLILDDGSGLKFYPNGTYARRAAQEVGRAVQHRRAELAQAHADLAEVAKLDGLLSAAPQE